ncbi:MAG: ORF6N domain-containing protein [Bacteroidetes bacterium]|nr:ORF6N domain-containing protein [Bacteroidota bacterium]MBU1374210.1 ORF6N domain-containing protein [Bacteroidota bacterium]MBU1485922.1 ORF6N domain-containing protein [Bacteroidota bacterium]MBU1761023.1 ORF6N domain-containing protein [Bacteroidota bacterium]MBU2269345.1 ORF6N domain-containing protein [Bacteroidota bacterium]
MSNDLTKLPEEFVVNKIHFIRGQNVMLDKDLAELYQVSTGNLNKAVSRNIKRFPDDFMFQLNEEEFKNLIFQNGTSSWGGTRKMPKAFTEQGVAMLSGVLNSDKAIGMIIILIKKYTFSQEGKKRLTLK